MQISSTASSVQADTHFRAVCRALVAETLEFSDFLAKVTSGKSYHPLAAFLAPSTCVRVCTIPAVDRPSSSPPLPPISAVAGAFFCSSILVLVGRFSPTMAFIDNSWESLVGSLLSSASLAFDLLLRGCSLVPPCVYDSSSLILASSPSPTSPLLLCMSGLNFPPLRSAECRAPGGRLSIVSAQRRLMDQCQPFSS